MQDAPERAADSTTVQIAAFVSPELKEALLVKAERNDRNLSQEVRRALKTYLHEEPSP
jgi:hypothetical protein